MQDVVGAMDNIDKVCRDTSEETQTISAAAQEQSASSEEIASAAHSLANLALDLQNAMSKFQV
jgi:methyl-accepting chemotaxis protein